MIAAQTVAALFVQKNGAYYGLPNVDPWPEERDARKYDGPHPVVAHPPCERWGRYWFGGPSVRQRKKLGDDGGCFASALASVRKWGGVLEHPAASHAWPRFGLPFPHRNGWSRMLMIDPGWVCEVAQSAYGHRARKLTWLYFVGDAPPQALLWERPRGVARLDDGFHSAEERRTAKAAGHITVERLGHHERAATPPAFRDLLLSIARSAGRGEK